MEGRKKLKKLLQEHFDRKDISVKRGTGTACGWTYITLPAELKNTNARERVNTILSQHKYSEFDLSTYMRDDYTDQNNYLAVSVSFEY